MLLLVAGSLIFATTLLRDLRADRAEKAPTVEPVSVEDGQASQPIRAAEEVSVAATAAVQRPGMIVVSKPGGGFLWKPVSEGDGKLVVLLPAKFTGHTVTASSTLFNDAACTAMHPDGDGRFAGVHNDNREHFRFEFPGGHFKPPIWFSVRLADGRQLAYPIHSPGERIE